MRHRQFATWTTGPEEIARTLDHFCNARDAVRRKSGTGFV
jgi:hypothetical protein